MGKNGKNNCRQRGFLIDANQQINQQRQHKKKAGQDKPMKLSRDLGLDSVVKTKSRFMG
jgi:hypothetical protein